jgi:2Fe-2S ferredoxin
MPKIIWHDIRGQRREVEVKAGSTAMEAALDHDVAGIIAECGGACACGTCHAYVAEPWLARLDAMDEMEDAMLEAARDRKPNSRLTCQIEIRPELDGLELLVARNEA